MKQIPFSDIHKNVILHGLSIVNVIQRNFEESYSETNFAFYTEVRVKVLSG